MDISASQVGINQYHSSLAEPGKANAQIDGDEGLAASPFASANGPYGSSTLPPLAPLPSTCGKRWHQFLNPWPFSLPPVSQN